MSPLDIAGSRRARPYTRREYAGRVLWSLAQPLFRFSPRPLFGWRRFLLRLFGAHIDSGANVYPSARICLPWRLTMGAGASIGEWALIYNLGRVTLGERSTVSHRAHLCAGTHDYRDATLPLLRVPIRIEPDAWICADAFVGPGVTIGQGAVVGAAAVVVKDVAPWQIVVGNPARGIGRRSLRSHQETSGGGVSDE